MTQIIIRKFGKGKLRASEIRNLLEDIMPSGYEFDIIEEFKEESK